MRGSSRRAEWVRVCTAEYLLLRTQIEPDPVLRPYATENPSEFFAVACEAFFEQPLALPEHKPALYAVLLDYFGQDTAARPRPPTPPRNQSKPSCEDGAQAEEKRPPVAGAHKGPVP